MPVYESAIRLLQIKLIDDSTWPYEFDFKFKSFTPTAKRGVPDYAVLSHTWRKDGDEVGFKDIGKDKAHKRAGWEKLLYCASWAYQDNLKYIWVDTCCIDKSSSQEMNEAFASMFHWYKKAARCYVYLVDFCADARYDEWRHLFKSGMRSSEISLSIREEYEKEEFTWKKDAEEREQFRECRWHTRGWTLQELIAPCSVEFFDRKGRFIGDKEFWKYQLSKIGNIPEDVLEKSSWPNWRSYSREERLEWADGRETGRKQDMVYCMMGLCSVAMTLNYNEGLEQAYDRLFQAIDESRIRHEFRHS